MTRFKRLLLATGVTLALSAPIAVGGAEAAPSTSDTTTITVRAGDSLAGIAWRHKVDLSALLRVNSLAITSIIHPGDTLVLPGGSTPPASAGAPSGTPRAAAGATTITVRAGDSLAGLARRHRVDLSALLRVNSLAITSVIHPGDTLALPTGATSTTTPTTSARSTTSSTTPTASAGDGTTYTVRPGDALSGIARRHGVTTGALVAANGITTSSVIHPGQSLRIPPATRSVPSAPTASPQATPVAPAPRATPAVPAPSGTSIDTLTSFLRAQVGLPYKFFSAGPHSYDCSGLVVAAFRQVGIALPHQSRALAQRGTAVDWRSETITAGDLVFTSAFDDPDRITHVGIALDSRRWIQAIGPGRDVSIGSLPSDSKIMEVRRINLP